MNKLSTPYCQDQSSGKKILIVKVSAEKTAVSELKLRIIRQFVKKDKIKNLGDQVGPASIRSLPASL